MLNAKTRELMFLSIYALICGFRYKGGSYLIGIAVQHLQFPRA